MTTLSIIILNHNTERLVAATIRSIEQALKKDWEIIVVDNASTDNSVSMIKKEFPHVVLIENKQNVGFAGGCNLGMQMAKGKYVMLLNSDALFTPHGNIMTLLEYLDMHPEVAVVTPKVVLASGKLDKASHRGFPTPWNALTYYTKLEALLGKVPLLSRLVGGYHLTWKSLDQPHEIDSATGAAMIVRHSAIEKVGMLDDSFFMYGEDIDWCYRFKQAGWKIVFHPGFTVLHLKNQSGIKRELHSPEDLARRHQTTSHFFDTMTQFYKKHYMRNYPAIVTRAVFFGISVLKKLKKGA